MVLREQDNMSEKDHRCGKFNRTLPVIVIRQTELVAAAGRGADAFFRGIKRDHNPFTLTMFAARVRGDRAVLLCVQAAAWWLGWDQASGR